MDSNDYDTDALLETIKKELNGIIASNTASKASPTINPKKNISKSKKSISDHFKEDLFHEKLDITKGNHNHNVDEDLQKMRIDLEKSYELFQNIGEKFETINFNALKNRIKDLHMSGTNNAVGRDTAEKLRHIFEESYNANTLSSLTKDMGNKFKKHPGEFGDIPELSAFFQACSQLQHGLEDLRKHREHVNKITQKITIETETSSNRIEEIRNLLEKSNKDIN